MHIDTGDIRSAGSVEYDYAFEGTVEITPCDELWPLGVSQGSQITGVFDNTGSAGVSTITVTATSVWDVATNTPILNNVVLLTAQMVNADGYWYLSELSTPNNYQGTTEYQITGGALFNGSVMRMDDSVGYFAFPGSTPVSNFGVDMSSAAPAIDLIDSDAIPEPATMFLLGLGAICFMRKK